MSFNKRIMEVALKRLRSDDRLRPQNVASFAVDEVVAACRPLWNETLSKSLARRFRREILILPDSDKPVINSTLDYLVSSGRDKVNLDIGTRCHPLIDAVHTAFSQHYPLTLSPDAIWLVIAQGFSHHIAENAESLRNRLVRHKGRRTLTERVAEVSQPAMQTAIAGLSAQIREASDPVLYETLLCDFSTSTPSIRTASEVVLMDSYSSYFEYFMDCICGIPRIMVTGTVEDWQRIRARVEVLETYDLGWWVGRLRPILDEFIRTVTGAADLRFWQAIYKPRQSYGDTCVTGWIADLFPYLNDAPDRRKNHVFESKRKQWAIPVSEGVETRSVMFDPEALKGVPTQTFPSGLSSVPLRLKLPDESVHELELVAGYFAVEQSAADLSLSPVIGWSVTEPRPSAPVLV